MQQSVGYVSEQLDSVLLQQIYPLLHSVSLPPAVWADEAVEKVPQYPVFVFV